MFEIVPAQKDIYQTRTDEDIMPIPVLDMYTTEEDVVVLCELPGLHKHDFKVYLDSNILVINGKFQLGVCRDTSKDASTTKNAEFLIRERKLGKFERRIRIPPEANLNTIKAKFHDGVLHVSFNKQEKYRSGSKMIHVH